MRHSALRFCAYLALAPLLGCADASSLPSTSATGGVPAALSGQTSNAPGPATFAAAEHRIIYTAELSLNAVDLAAAARRVSELTQSSGGYIASSDQQGSSGAPRSGRWTVRVPVQGYQQFLDEASALGELISRREDSQEATEEYVDLEARIHAKQEEDKRMLDYLQQNTQSLDQILQIERELMRIRTELEQMQGRLRMLADRTALATVTIVVHELQPFEPEESPSFGRRIARTWETSLGHLQDLGEWLTLMVVALGPWAAAASLPAMIAWRLLSRRGRSARPA